MKTQPYSGITIFDPSFRPPDLRRAANEVVDVSGTLGELIGPSVGHFACCRTLPEIAGTLSFRFEGRVALDPVVVQANDLETYASRLAVVEREGNRGRAGDGGTRRRKPANTCSHGTDMTHCRLHGGLVGANGAAP